MEHRQPVPSSLTYMPQSFHRRRGEVWKFAYLEMAAGAAFLIFDRFHPGESFAVLMAQATVLLLLAAGGILAWILGWKVDCQIEGTTLTIENRPMLAPISIDIAEILEIVTLVNPERTNEHEMVVRDVGRINVGPELFAPLEPLKSALLEINPQIKFTQRTAGTCCACGNPIVHNGATIFTALKTSRAGRCQHCGQPWARRGQFI